MFIQSNSGANSVEIDPYGILSPEVISKCPTQTK